MNLTKMKNQDFRKLARVVHCFLMKFRAIILKIIYSLNTEMKRKRICVFGIWNITSLLRNFLTQINSPQFKHLFALDLLYTWGKMKWVKKLLEISMRQFSVCQRIISNNLVVLEHILKCKSSTYRDFSLHRTTSWSSFNIKKSFLKLLWQILKVTHFSVFCWVSKTVQIICSCWSSLTKSQQRLRISIW